MKLRHVLSIILIGMISLTATATTAKLEQKQNPELVKEFTIQTKTVNVENELQAVIFQDVAYFQESNEPVLKTSNDHVTSFAIVSDVGWKSSERKFIQIPYTEKLLENYNKDFLHLMKEDKKPDRIK